MDLKLVPNWRDVLFHSWSVRLSLILAFFAAGDASFSYLAEGKVGWSVGIFLWSLGQPVVRVIKQVAVSGGDKDDGGE